MTYFCKLCDKSMMNKSKYNLFKSITHKRLDESFINRYFFRKPNINGTDGILRKKISIIKVMRDIRLVVY